VHFWVVLPNKTHWVCAQGPNFQHFPKTFPKDLPMSDDLGIPKKFSYLNFQWLFFAFSKNFFSYLPKLVQPIWCTYTDHVDQTSIPLLTHCWFYRRYSNNLWRHIWRL